MFEAKTIVQNWIGERKKTHNNQEYYSCCLLLICKCKINAWQTTIIRVTNWITLCMKRAHLKTLWQMKANTLFSLSNGWQKQTHTHLQLAEANVSFGNTDINAQNRVLPVYSPFGFDTFGKFLLSLNYTAEKKTIKNRTINKYIDDKCHCILARENGICHMMLFPRTLYIEKYIKKKR